MSAKPQRIDDNQEIDLSQLSKKLGGLFESFLKIIFNGILFLKRNTIVLVLLFVSGAVIGYYMDKNSKVYDNQIIVCPNFGSTDYLYAKIDLINSKINDGDSIFLKDQVGILDPKKLRNIEIEPITDVYKFIENNTANFELIKLMAEDGDLKKILEDNMTSKNYPFHSISFTTDKMTSDKKMVRPLLKYLNQSDYYATIQKEYLNNIKEKMVQNDTILSQIDGFLKGFTNTINGSQKSDKLVYYNENSQLNDVLKTKNQLISEQGQHRLELVNLDKIIKDNSATINIKNNKSLNGKMKLVVPVLFLFLFILGAILIAFYKRQIEKMNA